jgi:hypothetical protein
MEDDGNGPFLSIYVGHGHGDALSLLIGPENHELPRLDNLGDLGRLNLIENDLSAGHLLAPYYLVHASLSVRCAVQIKKTIEKNNLWRDSSMLDILYLIFFFMLVNKCAIRVHLDGR